MARTGEILSDITERLVKSCSHVCVDLFPGKITDYRLNHPIGALLVGYTHSRYEPIVDTGCIAQQRTLTGIITVIARQLNGVNGAIDLVDQVRAVLIGHRPIDCQPIWLTADTFFGEASGLWIYNITFKTKAMSIPDDMSEEGVNLNIVNYEEDL